MTLKELHDVELALMRQIFENACVIAGLSVEGQDLVRNSAYTQIAEIVQTLVERGVSDPEVIARNAALSVTVQVDPDVENLLGFPLGSA